MALKEITLSVDGKGALDTVLTDAITPLNKFVNMAAVGAPAVLEVHGLRNY
jgi:hypothetical protein